MGIGWIVEHHSDEKYSYRGMFMLALIHVSSLDIIFLFILFPNYPFDLLLNYTGATAWNSITF